MMRSKIRSLFYAVCGAAIVPACGGDDTSATGDGTETDADTGAADDNGESNPTSGTDPDTTAGDPTTDPSDATNPTTVDSSTGGPCLLPEEIFEDPSFESGTPSAAWGEASTVFNTPLCDESCNSPGGTAAASDGAWWVWLGGTAMPEASGVAQTVQINQLDELTLEFDFRIAAASGSPDDEFYVAVDGTEVFRATADQMAMYAEYTNISVDVSAFADGGEHEFEFISITNSGAVTNFFVDNIRMGGCDAGMAVTMGDSVTGIDPTGDTDSAGTDTDTANPVDMCDDDLGMAVPFTQAGNNNGAADDSAGSCQIPGAMGPGEDLAYSWTAPAAGVYQFDTFGSDVEDTVLYVYDACMDGMEIACNDDAGSFQSAVVIGLEADQTVVIVVDGWDDTQVGDFVLNISQVVCDAPTDLGNALPIAETGNNVGAGDEITPSCAPDLGGEDVTYTWTSPAAALYTFDTAGSTFETVVAGYIGTCGDPAAQIGCNSDGALSEFTTAVAMGDEVTVVVDGAAMGEEGAYDFNITQVGVLEGDCCAADATSGCVDAAVTNCVCGFPDPGFDGPAPDDATCCTGEWFGFCASLAGSACDGGCAGLTPGGSCCDAQVVGGCDVPAVQDCVCDFDAFCCDGTWDGECVVKAQLFCFSDCS